jgi:hypothetical protein
MSFLDKLKDKVADIQQHVSAAVDKIQDRTGDVAGNASGMVDGVQEKAGGVIGSELSLAGTILRSIFFPSPERRGAQSSHCGIDGRLLLLRSYPSA